jgi:hypothetical protein
MPLLYSLQGPLAQRHCSSCWWGQRLVWLVAHAELDKLAELSCKHPPEALGPAEQHVTQLHCQLACLQEKRRSTGGHHICRSWLEVRLQEGWRQCDRCNRRWSAGCGTSVRNGLSQFPCKPQPFCSSAKGCMNMLHDAARQDLQAGHNMR